MGNHCGNSMHVQFMVTRAHLSAQSSFSPLMRLIENFHGILPGFNVLVITPMPISAIMNTDTIKKKID